MTERKSKKVPRRSRIDPAAPGSASDLATYCVRASFKDPDKFGIYLRDYNVSVATFADNSFHARQAIGKVLDDARMKALAPADDPLYPALTLLVKLGSIAVHADEAFSADGHPLDRIAIADLLRDPEVATWVRQMDAMAFLPKKRRDRS